MVCIFYNFSVKNSVPILPIVFTYREVDDIRRFIKKKPFITLTILNPEYPNLEVSKESIKELKQRVYRKMNNERRMKKIFNEELNEDKELQKEKI